VSPDTSPRPASARLPGASPRSLLARLGLVAVAALAGCDGSTVAPAAGGAGPVSHGGAASSGRGGAGGTGSGGAFDPGPADGGVEPPELILAGEILGRPTATSVSVNVVPAKAVDAFVEVGTSPGVYTAHTPPGPHAAGEPFSIVVTGLAPDAAHVYRLRFREPGAPAFQAGPERRFHTARPPGTTFRFTVQADSHLDENSDLDQYHRTLDNVLADAPDFHLDLGDTFMCEKHSAPLTATVAPAPDEPTVMSRYVYERAHFGRVAHSAPLFLVNGNHDGELGYLFTGSGQDLATWATRARQRYYLNPAPDAFYLGDTDVDPVVGERAADYAFTWGDALFVALDPFWNAKVKPSKNGWGWTLGDKQYAFLADTLSKSAAKYKFVFLHNLVGGLDGQMRGGVEAAPYFEWGGADADLSDPLVCSLHRESMPASAC
jgi:hypothetical protein